MIIKMIFIKLVAIVAAVELFLMTVFYLSLPISPLYEALLDVFLLALLSAPLIYLFVLRPIEAVFMRQKKLEESMLHLSNQFIDNVTHEFDKKLQNVLSVTADAFETISQGAIYHLKNGTYTQHYSYTKNGAELEELPEKIEDNNALYLTKILHQKQSLFFCKNNETAQEVLKLFSPYHGCMIIIPMFSQQELEGFISFKTSSTQELQHDEILILMISAQMIVNAIKRHQIDQELKKFSNALMQTGDAVCITDKEGIIEYVNPAFEALSKYSHDELVGKSSSIMKSGLHDSVFYHRLWKTIINGQQFHDEFVNKDKNGTLYNEEKTISAIKNDEGTVTNYLSTGRNITQRKVMEHALRELATKDKLTNVFNRTQCELFYNRFVERKNTEQEFYLLLFDIDNFKKVNDTFGHQRGDEVLKEVASRVQEAIRDEDVLIRFGGEEFIVMTISENEQKVQSFAERIREVVASSQFLEVGQVTISIGLTRHDEGTTKELLLERADKAMYQAKKEGKNRVILLQKDEL